MAVAWLLLVGASYAALFLFSSPIDSRTLTRPPPDLADYSLAPLAAILILGIIRQFARVGQTPPDEGRE